jgi:hypothetical protein
VKVGDLVKYMSRTLLVLEIGDVWVYAIECGEIAVGRYRRSVLETIA